jgi:glycosyltransferase involved in cell wall biosynthesis
MYDKYAAIICISDQASANLKEYIGAPEKIHTILNGVNVDRFYRSSKDISRNKSFMISMIAAFRKEKDHETVLRAMSHLPTNYKLQLAGRDFDEKVPTLKQMCVDLGIQDRVDFLGARSDVPDLLEESDVVVMSSHWEGFGLAAVEAMAAGRPLIASDVGGLRDVVQGAGVLFPQGDDKELAQKVQFLCEHPDEYHEVATRCQNKAQQYNISKMAEKYIQLYQQLC